jgi:hypothetical protein
MEYHISNNILFYTNWISHLLRRKCLLKHVIEGTIERKIYVARRWGKRCKQLQEVLKKTGGCWKLKEEALERTEWRS